MRKITLLIISLFIVGVGFVSANPSVGRLLERLDKTIDNKNEFREVKERNIKGLNEQYNLAGSDEQKFAILGKLFNEYDNYQTDTAYKIVEERLALAAKMNNKSSLALAHMNLADVYRTTGLYKEAIETLNLIREKHWNFEDEAYYYHLCHSLYVLMSDYAVLDTDKQRYNKLVLDYKDSLLLVLDKNELSYPLVESTRYMMFGEFDKALEVLNAAKIKFGPTSPMLNYTLSDIYYHKGDIEEQKYYLALSAIGDIENSIKEYISLHRLAEILYKEGDLNRAYYYMKNSLDDAVFSNSRLRTLQVSKILPLVAAAHDHKNRQNFATMTATIAVIGVLAIILLISLYYIYRQLKQISTIKEAQKQLNKELQEANGELKSMNVMLEEANHVKVEYIGYLFNVCSSYISKLEDFRLLVKRNIQTNQVKQLAKMVDSSTLVSDELKEFYKNFDTIFLKIYPTFVEEFNALMTDEGKIYPKEGDLLTPELRIFALIRLGISDSVKIADFLHYSTQTIYNYRQKVRSKAIDDKDTFLEQVVKIGLD